MIGSGAVLCTGDPWDMLLDRINRSVPIEQELLDAANGRRPLPTAEDCRRMGLALGTMNETRPIRPGSGTGSC